MEVTNIFFYDPCSVKPPPPTVHCYITPADDDAAGSVPPLRQHGGGHPADLLLRMRHQEAEEQHPGQESQLQIFCSVSTNCVSIIT